MTPTLVRRFGSKAAGVLAAVLLTGVVAPGWAAAAVPALTPASPAPVGITTPGPLVQLTSSPSSPKRATAQSPAASTTTAALAQTASGPQLSITVDNGRTPAEPGEVLNYVLTLTNLGSDDVKGLWVTQSVPSGLTLVKADSGGRVKSGNVGWKVDLKAAAAATFHVTMKVSATPKDVLRLATVACAAVPAKASPIVCASHSDQ